MNKKEREKRVNHFQQILSSKKLDEVLIYCTGFPEPKFIENYMKLYNIQSDNKDLYILNGKDYSLIKNIGFNAISLWEYRRKKEKRKNQGVNQKKVDAWGRIYKNEWYLWEGVFKNEDIVRNWKKLAYPTEAQFNQLSHFLSNMNDELSFVLSLPGLFEKTWQSMGFVYFSKCLRNNLELIQTIINFFFEYIEGLIKRLQNSGATNFLIADDLGYNKRLFIPKLVFKNLFLSHYKKLVELIHKNNHKIILHSDGYISELFDIFIEIGFDGIQSIEPNAGNNIFKLFKKFGNKICFIGNLDNSTLLTFGSRNDVSLYLKNLLKCSRLYNSPLIISPTQQINSLVKPENIQTMIYTVQDFNLQKRQ